MRRISPLRLLQKCLILLSIIPLTVGFLLARHHPTTEGALWIGVGMGMTIGMGLLGFVVDLNERNAARNAVREPPGAAWPE